MSALPNVYAFCLTYGRPRCVSNIVWQWERMEYDGNRYLVIVDDGNQYQHEPRGETWEVLCVKHRFASLGEKANFACALSGSEHDLLVVMEDDDYYTPWTLKAHAEAFRHAPISIPHWFFMEKKDGKLRLHRNKNLSGAHAGWAFGRDVFRRVGGYPWIDIPHDHNLRLRLWERGFEFADPTEKYPPYLVSRLLTSEEPHLSKMRGEDPWREVERDLHPVDALDPPEEDKLEVFDFKIRDFFGSNGSESMLMVHWRQHRLDKGPRY